MTRQEQARELVRQALGEVMWAKVFAGAPLVKHIEEALGPNAFAPQNTAALYEFYNRHAQTFQVCRDVQDALERAANCLADALELMGEIPPQAKVG